MSSLFSIIIPVYNTAPYLGACLDSLLGQDCADWETICVDDGSTDGSGAVLDAYQARDARFKVVHQPNRGVGETRNKGLSLAQGAWILFLDADDVLAPIALGTLRDLVRRYPHERLFGFGYESFNEEHVWRPVQPLARVAVKDIAHELTVKELLIYFFQFLYARDLVQKKRFPRYIRGEDRVFIDDILLNAVGSFVETNAILYGYRQRQTSVMHRPPSLQIIRDEMDHRRDIVNMIEASPKHVAYAGNWWLEGYFTADVGALAAGRPAAERRAIREHWQMCAREMRKAKGFSRRARWVFAVCTRFPSPFVWWLFCRAWPRISPYRFCRRVAGRFVREVRKIAFERKQK